MTTASPPATLARFRPKLEAFKRWLIERGSAMLATTNEYEVIRFHTAAGPGIIYYNKRGRLSFNQTGHGAFVAFYTGGSDWRAVPRATIPPDLEWDRSRKRTILALVERDGWTCGLCGGALTPRTTTIEHFVPRTAGGSDHPANLLLAHRPCNVAVAHASAREKIEIILRLRQNPIHSAPDDPWEAVDLPPYLREPAA